MNRLKIDGLFYKARISMLMKVGFYSYLFCFNKINADGWIIDELKVK